MPKPARVGTSTPRSPRARSVRAPRPSSALVGYVLHRYDWSESSLILDLFTREEGRLAVAAKGAKRPYSQWRSVLLPFQRITVSVGRTAPRPDDQASQDLPAAEVQTLRAAEWAGGAAMLTGAALFSGFYLNELLLRLLARHDPHPHLFDAYARTLPAIASAIAEDDDPAVEAALRAFELTLLRQTGLLPDLSVATLTRRPVDPAAAYTLSPEAGVVAEPDAAASLDGATLIGLEAALQHGSLEALQLACRGQLAGLKRPLRAAIQHQLGSAPLRTRRVMAGLRGLRRSALPGDRPESDA